MKYVIGLQEDIVFSNHKHISMEFFIQLHEVIRSEEHTSELQSRFDLVCRLLLEKKNAIRKAMKYDYNLIILDLMLPEIDGLEVCKHLRDNRIFTPILMLSATDNELDKIHELEIG